MKKKELWVAVLVTITAGILNSCESWERNLGQDLLPPGDAVFLHHDTLELKAWTISSEFLITSDLSSSNTTSYLLGSFHDTAMGRSTAELWTQFNPTGTYLPAPNTEVDSAVLHLYIPHYHGSVDDQYTISVHEATERIYFDSLYFSNYSPADQNYIPLGDISYMPKLGGDTVDIQLGQRFIDRFLEVAGDTAVHFSDSLFKDYFYGLYITGTSPAPEGCMAAVALSDIVSRVSVWYRNDSTFVDSLDINEQERATFSITEFSSQKINAFEHEIEPGSQLSRVLDNEDSPGPWVYVQGMGGVSTRLTMPSLEKYADERKVAVSAANLIFEVVSEDSGGVALDYQPKRLILLQENEDGALDKLHDYTVVAGNDPTLFGGELRAGATGLFQDTLYTYSFKMPLHLQGMIDGTIPGNTFRLGMINAQRNPLYTKLHGNLSTGRSRIRLEIVYLKL